MYRRCQRVRHQLTSPHSTLLALLLQTFPPLPPAQLSHLFFLPRVSCSHSLVRFLALLLHFFSPSSFTPPPPRPCLLLPSTHSSTPFFLPFFSTSSSSFSSASNSPCIVSSSAWSFVICTVCVLGTDRWWLHRMAT